MATLETKNLSGSSLPCPRPQFVSSTRYTSLQNLQWHLQNLVKVFVSVHRSSRSFAADAGRGKTGRHGLLCKHRHLQASYSPSVKWGRELQRWGRPSGRYTSVLNCAKQSLRQGKKILYSLAMSQNAVVIRVTFITHFKTKVPLISKLDFYTKDVCFCYNFCEFVIYY